MKPKNIIAAIFAVLVLCLGNFALANDLSGQPSGNVMTVNVNEADAASIANMLVGVGISRAQAIVDYRDQYGRFYSAEELTAVKGIGQSTVERNLSRISIE
jgi:competence protein ComEA